MHVSQCTCNMTAFSQQVHHISPLTREKSDIKARCLLLPGGLADRLWLPVVDL